MTSYEAGELEEALAAWNQALGTFRRSGQRLQEAETLKNLGWVYDDLSQYDEALRHYQESLTLSRKLGDRKLQGQVLNNLGVVYNNLARPTLARDYFLKSLTLRRELQDQRGEAATLNNLGLTYDLLGDNFTALQHYQASLAIYRQLPDLNNQGKVLGNIGVIYKELSDYPKALDYYAQSLTLKRQTQNRSGESITLSNIGLIYDLLGDYERAQECYQKSLEICIELEDKEGEADVLTNLGVVLESQGDYAGAFAAYQQSLTIRRELGDRQGEGIALNNLGNIHLQRRHYDDAYTCYQQDLAICRELGDPRGECLTLTNLGRLFLRQQNFTAALTHLEQARQLLETQPDEVSTQNVYYALGEYYSLTGQTEQAIASFRRVIDSVERIRGRLSVEGQKSTYAASVMDVYQALSLLLVRQGRDEEAYHTMERARARAFLDLLATGEVKVGKSKHAGFLRREESLRPDEGNIDPTERTLVHPNNTQTKYSKFIEKKRRYEPELTSLVSVDALTLREVQALLDPRTTLLEYFITSDQLLIWVIRQNRTILKSVNVSADSLTLLVRGFRDAIASGGLVERRAQGLYRLLIEPVRDQLQTESLIIIPHGVLHYLPFPALSEKPGQYLLEAHSIRYLPSASVLKYLKTKRRTVGNKLLAIGNPKAEESSGSRLPQSEAEVRDIARLYSRPRLLIGAEATERKFKDWAPDFEVLHLACHGELNAAYPLFSKLSLAPGEAEDGDLNVYELFSLDLKAYLVVLSACQTGLGRLTNADDLIGLSRAFMYAGTPSVLCSLWRVEDESTAYLMRRFYEHLRQVDKAEALRRAQLETRQIYQNPYSWAGFILIGESF